MCHLFSCDSSLLQMKYIIVTPEPASCQDVPGPLEQRAVMEVKVLGCANYCNFSFAEKTFAEQNDRDPISWGCTYLLATRLFRTGCACLI